MGRGPLPGPGASPVGFAQLRTAHFLTSLIKAGHSVRTILLGLQDRPPTRAWAQICALVDEGPNWIERAAAWSEGAEVVVSAGPYNPGRLAAAIAGARPFFADLPGDPFAELQALHLAPGGAPSPPREAAAFAAAIPTLARADAVSVVSRPQRFCALGQLGLMGRLRGPGGGPGVFTIPIAHQFDLPRGVPRAPRGDGELVVALSGGFNSWFDDHTLCEGLDLAMRAVPRLRVVVTGGGLEGHYEDGYARFRAWAARQGSRVLCHGWLPHAQVPAALAPATVGICLDRPGAEPELGSRTRVLFFAWLGMQVVATPRCDLARQLVGEGLVRPVQLGSPRSLCATLESLAAEGWSQRASALDARLRLIRDPMALATPMLAFVADPVRLPPAEPPEARLAQSLDQAKSALSAVHGSPTWRALSTLDRWTRRRRSEIDDD